MRDELFNFTSPSERKILTEALEDFNQVDMEEPFDALSDHGCKVRVTRENIETVIAQIATNGDDTNTSICQGMFLWRTHVLWLGYRSPAAIPKNNTNITKDYFYIGLAVMTQRQIPTIT